ncbi:MAG: LppX_LprAFG lipoprotein [Nocardioidaceae bacterium]
MRTHRTGMTLRLSALLLAATAVLAGCSSDSKQPTASPEDTLAAAKTQLDETSGVHIGLTTKKLPAGVSGLLAADGVATHAPAFQGAIKVAASGVTADASVVAVNGVVHAKLPFTSRFVRIDPADYGAPDPADLMNRKGGLSSLLTAARDVKEGDKVRQGKVVQSTYTATVPGTAVAAIIPSATSSADFDAEFTVNDENQLTKTVLTGPFYPGVGDVTYSISFDDYGIKRKITAPPS